MKTRKTRAGEAGFTLLEAIIAMAILAIGIITVCMMQGSALRASTTAFKRTEAINVALALVEAMQQLPSDDPMLEAIGDGKKDSEYEKGGNGTREVKLIGGESGGVFPPMDLVMREKLEERTSNVHRCENRNKKCGAKSGTTNLEKLLEPSFEVLTGDKEGKIRDRTGTEFELAWAVQDVMVTGIEDKNGNQAPSDKLIRIYMQWKTPMGINNHLEFTTNKFAKDIND